MTLKIINDNIQKKCVNTVLTPVYYFGYLLGEYMVNTWQESLEIQRQNRREEIIEVAFKLFLEKDIHEVTMKEVVEQSNISRVTLYKYYKSIHEIIYEIQVKVLRKLLNTLETNMSSGKNGLEKLQILFETMLSFFDNHASYLRFTSQFDYYYRNSYPSKDFEDNYLQFISSEAMTILPIREGIRDGSIRNDLELPVLESMVANTFIGMAQRMAMRGQIIETEHQIHTIEVLRQTYQMLYEYLKAR